MAYIRSIRIAKNFQAYTLIEVMIALFLSSLLLIGLIALNNALTANVALQNAWTRIQDEGRYTITFLNRRIREAGFSQCVKNVILPQDALMVYAGAKTPSYWNIKVWLNSDVLVLGACVLDHGHEQYIKTAYFISDTGRKNRLGQVITGLFEKREGGRREELAEGIETLKIKLGIRNEAIPDIVEYLNAQDVTQWQWVRSIELALLINSVEPVLKYPQTVWFDGDTVVKTDGLLHKPWYSYIALREYS